MGNTYFKDKVIIITGASSGIGRELALRLAAQGAKLSLAARGKRYTSAVASFEYDLEKNLIEIEHDLKNETYELSGYHSFQIDKPKRRLVNAAPFRDRVVHHALMNVIEPFFERQINRKKNSGICEIPEFYY